METIYPTTYIEYVEESDEDYTDIPEGLCCPDCGCLLKRTKNELDLGYYEIWEECTNKDCEYLAVS